ncbi:MAG: hypothetical protein C5B59_07330 [Bacteroidetes bacterium]|nr:MAG: hypothetical protein C5B59_07330 [Bacteroidota bacterium]
MVSFEYRLHETENIIKLYFENFSQGIIPEDLNVRCHKIRLMLRRLFILFACAVFMSDVHSQTKSTQIWTDFQFVTPMPNRFRWDNQLTYRNDLSSHLRWDTYELTSLVSKSIGNHIEAIGYLLLAYTDQTNTINTGEIRLGLGIRYFAINNPRLRLAALLRYESRSFYNFDSSVWTHDDRIRFRAESLFAINGRNISARGALSTLIDAEVFWTTDREVDERFASRIRLRGGFNYALTERWRFQLLYAFQGSRNTLTKTTFNTSQQNIIWLRAIFVTR